MKLLERLSSAFQYYGTLTMMKLIRSLPYDIAISIGRAIMLPVWAFMPLRRRLVKIQMEAALGLHNPWRLVIKVFMNQGELLVDAIRYAYMSDEEIRAKIVVEGKENLDEAASSGRGIMIFTGHIGNWEILSNAPRLIGVQLWHMADVRKDARLESIINEMRTRSGVKLLPTKGKALMLIKQLKKGNTISMIVDQRGKRRDGLLCDVFGMPAVTNPGPAFIAIKGKAIVLPVYTVKVDGTHKICISKPVDALNFGEGDEAIARLSFFMQSWVASVVEQYPDQWFWLHSKWMRRNDFRNIKTSSAFKDFVFKQAERLKMERKKR